MHAKQLFQYLVILFFLPGGCGGEKVSVISHDLTRTDFIDKIDAMGTIRATSTLTIVTPRVHVSNMTVIFLADEGDFVKKGDTVCILDAADIAQRREIISDRLEQNQMDLNKLMIDNDVNISSLESKLEDMEMRIALNSLDSIQKQFATPAQQRLFALELEKANVEKLKLQKQYAAAKQIYEAELRGMNSRIKTAENNLQRVVDQINSLTIVAPQDGIVMHTTAPVMTMMSSMGALSVGGKIAVNSSVFPNMPLLQMPDIKEMEVTVEVYETEYRRISAGQEAHIRVDALNHLKTTGKIKRKTLVGITPDRQSSVKLYEVIVSIDSLHSMLTPGLSAACQIMVNQVKDTVVVPSMAIFEKDSLKIVYVAEGGKFLPVTVETGLSNSSGSIISKGLTGNETIALVEPPRKLIIPQVNANKALSATPDSLKSGLLPKIPQQYD